MRGADEPEGKLRGQFYSFTHLDGLEVLQGVFGFLKGVERQGGIVLGLFGFVVEARVFFLQVAGVGKDDAA